MTMGIKSQWWIKESDMLEHEWRKKVTSAIRNHQIRGTV